MGIWNVRIAGGDLARLSYYQRRVIYRKLYVAPIDYVTAHLSDYVCSTSLFFVASCKVRSTLARSSPSQSTGDVFLY